MAVLHFIRFTDRESFALIKDKSRIHVIRKETDLNTGRNELHRAVIADLIDGNSSIFTDLAIDAIKEAVIEPLSGCRDTRVILCISEAFQWSAVDTGMDGSVIGTHVILEHSVKLSQ